MVNRKKLSLKEQIRLRFRACQLDSSTWSLLKNLKEDLMVWGGFRVEIILELFVFLSLSFNTFPNYLKDKKKKTKSPVVKT